MNTVRLSALIGILFFYMLIVGCRQHEKTENTPLERSENQYKCPVKCSEQRYTLPGKCPNCGMMLEKVIAG